MTKKPFVLAGCLALASIPVVHAQTSEQQIQQLNQRVNKLEKQVNNAKKKKSGSGWIMKGHDGRLEFETRNGRNKFAVQGRMQLDGYVASNAKNITQSDPAGTGIVRRGRFRIVGVIDKDWEYHLQYGFVHHGFEDLYLGYTGFHYNLFGKPVHSEIIGGNQFNAIGFHVSSKYRNFMEGNNPAEAFRPGRDMGLSYRAWQKHWNLWASFMEGYGALHAPTLKDGGVASYIGSVRFVLAPINRKRHVLAIYNSVSFQKWNKRSIGPRYRARPGGSRGFDERLIDTGDLNASSSFTYTPAVAFEDGRLDAVGEYYLVHDKMLNGAPNPTFTGWNAQVGYFLTDDYRPFSSHSDGFGRVHPRHPLSKGGIGAWQVAARGEQVDLNSKNINGGKMTDVVAALNWWPTGNLRWQLQYVNTISVKGGHYDGEHPIIYETRIQYDF